MNNDHLRDVTLKSPQRFRRMSSKGLDGEVKRNKEFYERAGDVTSIGNDAEYEPLHVRIRTLGRLFASQQQLL